MIRPWRTRAGLIMLLAGLSTALVTGSAAAAGEQRAAAGADADFSMTPYVKSSPGKLDVTLTAFNDTTGVAIDPATIHVDAVPKNGQAQSLAVTASKQTQPQAAMLLVDTSDSMDEHHYFQAAKNAAKQFLKAAPGDVEVGLTTFGDPAMVLLPPTLDHDKVAARIDSLKTNGNTAMYQAVVRSVAVMHGYPLRSLVMLTDGQNDQESAGAKTSATQAKKALGAKGGQVGFKGILIGDESDTAIDMIQDARSVYRDTSGDITGQLSHFFTDQAATYQKQQHIVATVPAALAGREAQITITAISLQKQPLSTGTFSYTLGTAQNGPISITNVQVVAPGHRASAIGTPVAVAAGIALFGGLAMLIFLSSGALVGRGEQESEVVRRLQVYSVSGARSQPVVIAEQTTRLGDNAFTRSAVGLVDRLTARIQLERSLDSRLEAAGLPLRTAEWTLLHIGAGVGFSLLLLVVTRGKLAGLILGLILGLALPWLALSFMKSRRENKFMGQLPETLQLLAGSIAAGYSLPQAMDSVVRESEPPISSEFNRALVEARLGMLAEDAMEGIATRTGSQDFSWIVMAIRIQREVGGNLAALLNSVADTLRERERLRRQVRALSAEGKLSGFILGALPIVFALYLVLVRPDYISPLFTTPLGLVLLILGSVLLVVGGFWMSRVIKVEV